MSFLQLAGLTKTFDATTVLRGVDLSLDEGGFLAVLGPSGCGKSTLLRILAGLEAQDTGTVRIGGEAVDGLPPMARDIAMVFQSYALYPHMTVAENLALPLVMRRLTRRERLPLMRRLDRRVAEKRSEIRGEIERMAEVVALDGLLERKPKALSGGQRQRVALARALVRRPRLFLLDEPLSNLDASLRAATRTEIVELQRRVGVTTVYVTHDQTEAMTMADRIAVMLEGRLEQIGSARDIYRRPATLAVARFIGSPMISVLPGQVRSGRLELTNGTAIGQLAIADQKVEIGLRAEDIAVGPAP
ncbi:MAG: ABC transporter ATP-binding protein, partial [Pseudomonadota bacterium]